VDYPDDPFLLSYAGYLAASVDRKYRKGIEACESAIELFERALLQREDSDGQRLAAVLFLNLAKAFLAGGKRKEAFDALQKARRSDPRNREVLAALEGMGIRRQAPLPFLDRSNPINVLIGRIFHKHHAPPGPGHVH
jgi:tetratricopeptide (TPR) repeat protein